MHLRTYTDLKTNVIRHTQLGYTAEGDTYLVQTTKNIRYKITLPEEEGSRIFYAWSAATCAQTLRDNGIDFDTQHVYMLFNPNTGIRPLSKCKERLAGVVVEKIPK